MNTRKLAGSVDLETDTRSENIVVFYEVILLEKICCGRLITTIQLLQYSRKIELNKRCGMSVNGMTV